MAKVRWRQGDYRDAQGVRVPVALRGRVGYAVGMPNTPTEILADLEPTLVERWKAILKGSMSATNFRHALWCGTLLLLLGPLVSPAADLLSEVAANYREHTAAAQREAERIRPVVIVTTEE